jgi:hypothetical protein
MTTIGRTTVVGQPDVLLQKVVMTELNPLTLQGKIFFKKDNAFNADTIDIFEATIYGILKDTPISVNITTTSTDDESLPVAIIKQTCYQVVTKVDFIIERLENKDKNIFNVLSSLTEACLRYAIKTKETKDLYEAIKKDFEMYKSDTSTEEEECD